MLSVQQQKFAENLTKGLGKRESYIDAFHPKNIRSAAVLANKLLKKPEVLAFMAELKGEMCKASVGELTDLINKLNKAFGVAEHKEDARGMVGSVMAQAELMGLVKSKNDSSDNGGMVSIISNEAILAKINERRNK